MDLRKQIREKQIELGMSNREFAKYIGVSYQWVNYFFKDNRPVNSRTFINLTSKLGISIETIEKYNNEVKKERGK